MSEPVENNIITVIDKIEYCLNNNEEDPNEYLEYSMRILSEHVLPKINTLRNEISWVKTTSKENCNILNRLIHELTSRLESQISRDCNIPDSYIELVKLSQNYLDKNNTTILHNYFKD